MDGFENYLDYALAMGQDNMMTRFLSNDPLRHIPHSGPPPSLDEEGTQMLQEAKHNLSKYNLVIGLSNFDQGIYHLSTMLDWNSIPLYRPRNRSDHPLSQQLSKAMIQRLNDLLRFDILLYEHYKAELEQKHSLPLACGSKYHFFSLRQTLIGKVARLFNLK